jgi:CRP-like cAMP-binding protein
MLRDSPIQERILELGQVPLLRALPPGALSQLAEAVELEAYPAGSSRLQEGRSVAAVEWVLEGRVRWTRQGRAIGEGGLGTSIGALELLAGADASAGAIAASPVLVARLPGERWLEVLEDSFELLHAVLSTTAAELCTAGRRVLERAPALPSGVGPLPADVDFVERLIRLRTSRPFVRAPIRALALLARRCEVRRLAPGAALWEPRREARQVVVVLAGEVRDGTTGVGPSSTAGLLEALAGVRHHAAASASAPTVALVLDVEALIDALEDDDELALELSRAAAAELLAVRLARGLPPDFFDGAPDRSLPRVAPLRGRAENASRAARRGPPPGRRAPP